MKKLYNQIKIKICKGKGRQSKQNDMRGVMKEMKEVFLKKLTLITEKKTRAWKDHWCQRSWWTQCISHLITNKIWRNNVEKILKRKKKKCLRWKKKERIKQVLKQVNEDSI